MQDKILSDFNSLPAEAQRQVADFIALLQKRYQRSPVKQQLAPGWENDPFVGLWQDREEMQDSTAWVRHLRGTAK